MDADESIIVSQFTGLSPTDDSHAIRFNPNPPPLLLLNQSDMSIVFGNPVGEVLRLDKFGMTYKGRLVEDAGEAYRAVMEWMRSTGTI